MPEPHKQSLEGQSTFGPPLPVDLSPDQVKAAVAERYGRVATSPQEKLGFPVGRQFAESVGYDPKALNRLPAGLGESFTGAGNPQPFVDPALGETLLDLGCGAGLDLALYAERIGPTGRLIGLDISAQMLAKSRNARDSQRGLAACALGRNSPARQYSRPGNGQRHLQPVP